MSDFSLPPDALPRFSTPPKLILMEANTGFGMAPPKPIVIPPLVKVETKTEIPALTQVSTTPRTQLKTTELNPLNPLGGPDFGFSAGPQQKPSQEIVPPLVTDKIPRYVPQPFPKVGDNVQVGDLVCRRDGMPLMNGEVPHQYGVLVSLSPFVIYSREVDVYWLDDIRPEDFRTVGKTTSALFTRCMASFHLIKW